MQIETFSRALQTGQIDLSQFGLPSETGFAAADFLQAIEKKVCCQSFEQRAAALRRLKRLIKGLTSAPSPTTRADAAGATRVLLAHTARKKLKKLKKLTAERNSPGPVAHRLSDFSKMDRKLNPLEQILEHSIHPIPIPWERQELGAGPKSNSSVCLPTGGLFPLLLCAWVFSTRAPCSGGLGLPS